VIRVLTVVVALLLCATPAAADETFVDLTVAVTLDKEAYELTDGVGATVTVTNRGTAPATAIAVAVLSGVATEWRWTTPPADALAPGESTTGTAVNDPFEPGRLVSVSAEATSAEPDRTPEDNHAEATAPMLNVAGDVEGLLYRDHDEDGVADPGEALSGARVYLVPTSPRGDDHSVRTGDGGRFAISDVLMGAYEVEVVLPAGWRLADNTVEIRPGPNQIELRAVPAFTDRLTATLEFDRDSYLVGDTAHGMISITNTGAADLAEVAVFCLRRPDILVPQRGDMGIVLETEVTVPSGATRLLGFSDVVTHEMWRYGRIDIQCVFGDNAPGLVVRAVAAVPGGRGVASGFVQAAGEGDPVAVPNLALYLVDRVGAVVARGVTDGDGRFSLPDLPADQYELRFSGPWRPAFGAVQMIDVVVGGTDPVYVLVLPGPSPSPPPSPPVVTDAPAPAARPAPARLADTGADVVELTGLGVLLVLAGAGLLVVRRRRNFVS
jgi:LPXTG-motif cell wall-anchored protein